MAEQGLMSQKVALGVVAALLIQTAGFAWWAGQQFSIIKQNQVMIEQVNRRVNETFVANLQRDVASLKREVGDLEEKIEELEDEIMITPTFEHVSILEDRIIQIVDFLNSLPM